MKHDEEAFRRGQQDADADIAVGCPRLFWQTRHPWEKFFVDLMWERFRVRVEHIGDLTTSERNSYERGYNQTVARHIDGTYGAGAFKNATQDLDNYRRNLYEQWKRD